MSAERVNQLIEAGLWLRLSGDLEGARRLFEQALKLDPGSARIRELLGNPADSASALPAEFQKPPPLVRPLTPSTMPANLGMPEVSPAAPAKPGKAVKPLTLMDGSFPAPAKSPSDSVKTAWDAGGGSDDIEVSIEVLDQGPRDALDLLSDGGPSPFAAPKAASPGGAGGGMKSPG